MLSPTPGSRRQEGRKPDGLLEGAVGATHTHVFVGRKVPLIWI